jgi:hypothetical protein
VQSWLDVFGGNWAANAPAMSLTVLAIASFVAGLWALLGELGLILAALTMVLIGNPVSRASVRLPSCCPNRPAPSDSSCRRAGGNLLRSTGFFDGIAVGGHAASSSPGRSRGWSSYSPREQGTGISRQSGPRPGLANAGMDGAR